MTTYREKRGEKKNKKSRGKEISPTLSTHFSLLYEQPSASTATYALTRLVVDLEGSSTISMDKDAPRTFYEYRMEWWAQPLGQLLYFSATLKADSPGLLLTYRMLKTPQKLS